MDEKLSDMGDQFLGAYFIFKSAHALYLVEGEKIVRHWGSNFWGGFIIFTYAHALYLVVGKLSDMGDPILGECTSFLRLHMHYI